jgi:hypothetical protein
MPDKLTIALSYYNAPLMLQEHLKHWREYPDQLLNSVKVILIDDGSMIHPAEKELKSNPPKISIELYRITKDIPQNIWGARNLAFHIASVERVKWVLCLDIDHVLPSRGLDGFSEIRPSLNTNKYYHTTRYMKMPDGICKIDKHIDSFLINPDLFWKVGGYDESLTGYYFNGAGFRFRTDLKKLAQWELLTKMHTLFYPSTIIDDASPLSGYERKRNDGWIRQGEPSTLNFEWERVL